MINRADVSKTELILPGSRLRNTLLVAGREADLAAFRDELQLGDRERLRTPDDARPEIKTALERAEQFLNLAALTAIVLAGLAIALAARGYSERNISTVALLPGPIGPSTMVPATQAPRSDTPSGSSTASV